MDIGKIERDIAELKELKKSDDRLAKARLLLAEVQDAERECARDFSIPFDIVSRVRAQIPIIEGHVNRLEAGLIRRGR
jgi:hypothetical protein